MIIEYERLMDMGVKDTTSLRDLASAYGQQGRTDEQVSVLKKILVFDPNNSGVQSDLARAYEESGDDPLEIFKDRYENNTDNVSYATEYAEKLIFKDTSTGAGNDQVRFDQIFQILSPNTQIITLIRDHIALK